jgi:hypothetical protein
VRAYDLAGNKSAASNIVIAELPLEVEIPSEIKKPIARPAFLNKPTTAEIKV